MRLEYKSSDALQSELIRAIGKHIDLKKHKVFFFGSRVTGQGDDRSDIDIGIEGPKPIPIATWLELKDEIENLHTLYTIDLVDFRKVDPSFYQAARQQLELIN